jgi:hypothetical protein
MAIKSNVRLHVQMSGDLTVDNVYNMENPNCPGVVFFQVIPGGSWYEIFNPLPLPGTVLSGLVIIPPRDNPYVYNLVTDINGQVQQSAVLFHPTNPSLFSIRDIPFPLKLSHNAGNPAIKVTFQFIWI